MTDLVTGDDGSSMAAGFMQWETHSSVESELRQKWTVVLERGATCSPRRRIMIAKAGDVMFIPKGCSINLVRHPA
ncbi:hypothetical protein ACVXG9_29030 [Escherichia coli]